LIHIDVLTATGSLPHCSPDGVVSSEDTVLGEGHRWWSKHRCEPKFIWCV